MKHDTEWLLTNARGAFAMGSPTRLPFRKYHGLLIARIPGFPAPLHVLAEVGETVRLGGVERELGAFRYRDAIHPKGFELLSDFQPRPHPTWTYDLGAATLTRTLTLHPHRPVAELCYRLSGKEPAELRLSPFFSARSAHAVSRENPFLCGQGTSDPDGVRLAFYSGFPDLRIRTSPPAPLEGEGSWNRTVLYEEEVRRGYDGLEDLFCPGAFRLDLKPGEEVSLEVEVLAGAVEPPAFPRPTPKKGRGLAHRLEEAAEDFLVETEPGRASMIAGYPWFGEWGRDTFVSLPGLLLARGEMDRAAAVFGFYGRFLKGGLVPNVLGADASSSDAHSVDATLFLVRALRMGDAEARRRGHPDWAEPWIDGMLAMLDALKDAPSGFVRVEPSGLLWADARPRALTWMDASVDGVAVTPRAPYAVELNALFYDALLYGLDQAKRLGRHAFVRRWERVAQAFPEAFRARFWLAERGYLADAHDGEAPDGALRPNQLFALTTIKPLLAPEEARSALRAVRERLLTPCGLRTLASDHPSYRGTCQGAQRERDLAYHQGTVWPWLMGPYADAVLAVEGPARLRAEVTPFLRFVRGHLDEACLGQVSEIFDGDVPHAPRGAPAQAWSVGEALRVALMASSTSRPRKAPGRSPRKRRQASGAS